MTDQPPSFSGFELRSCIRGSKPLTSMASHCWKKILRVMDTPERFLTVSGLFSGCAETECRFGFSVNLNNNQHCDFSQDFPAFETHRKWVLINVMHSSISGNDNDNVLLCIAQQKSYIRLPRAASPVVRSISCGRDNRKSSPTEAINVNYKIAWAKKRKKNSDKKQWVNRFNGVQTWNISHKWKEEKNNVLRLCLRENVMLLN